MSNNASAPAESRHPDRAVDHPSEAVGHRFAGLEGYRGIAALAIVVYHVFQNAQQGGSALFEGQETEHYTVLQGLDAFVSVFFVLSAFLLALPYMQSALAGRSAPNGRAFLFRRAARVVPLYVVAITVVWSARNPEILGDWVGLLRHLTFTQIYDQERIFHTIGPAWSLAVEVQFYLLLALGGWLATRVTVRMAPQARLAFLLGVTTLIALGSMGWKLYAEYVLGYPADAWHIWFGLPAKLDSFALGILLAILVAHRPWNLSALSLVTLRVGGSAVVVAAFLSRPSEGNSHLWFHTIVSVGFVLILASTVMGRRDMWVRALSTRPLAFLGVISYSLYLWHEPVLHFMTGQSWFPAMQDASGFTAAVLLVVTLSVVVAWVSYHILEEPLGKIRAVMDRQGRSRDYYDGS